MRASNIRKIGAVAGLAALAGLGFALPAGLGDDGDGAAKAAVVQLQPGAAPGERLAKVGDPGQEYDRNALLVSSRRAGAASGWRRGEEIWYMRCWICHSEYVIAADHFPAPSHRDIGQRRDAAFVRAMIRSGSPNMPRYGQETLSDADLEDLVAFMMTMCGWSETGGGCFDENNPPPNPFYRYEVTDLRRPDPRRAARQPERPS